ncbi:MAG TPA: alpha/beta fold hydrolase [Polyangia bacterium]|jgi:pimeloyl-ACP methyl ester carboxylesterase
MRSRHPIARGGLVAAGALIATLIVISILQRPSYAPRALAPPASFEAFLEAKLAQSRAAGARPGNEERLLRVAPGRTPLAILYIHGYGASRAEGEEVVDRVAREVGANAYYLRLPGHGTTKEDQRRATYRDYLAAAEEALAAMPLLGDKTVVMGSSMGGLIATWLAAAHPDRVAAIAVASPFYAFADGLAQTLFAIPGGRFVVELAKGKLRSSAGGPRDVPGWQAYWYEQQYYAALQSLADLAHLVGTRPINARVRCPVLLLYYPGDQTASVAGMRRAFAEFGGTGAKPAASRMVAVADGDHVLLSQWIRTDKATPTAALSAFLQAVVGR